MPPMKFSRVTPLGALVCCSVLALSACGGSSKPTNAGGPRAGLPSGAADPCRLATPAEVGAAVGAPVSAPLRSSVAGVGGTVLTCTWRGTAANPESVAELDVYPSTAAFDQARKTQSTATGNAATGSGFHEISGVGDAAFAGEQGIIWVRKGNSAFTVHWFDPQNPPLATVGKGAALAKVVAAKV
jgi:hypothetical protein